MNFYDTNALLLLQDGAFKEPFALSIVTLYELERIKTDARKDQDVKYRARKVTKLLDKHMGEWNCVDASSASSVDLPADQAICYDAKQFGCDRNHVFVTDDIACKMIARNSYGLNIASAADACGDDHYKGYRLFKGNEEEINEYLGDPHVGDDFAVNEYLVIENTSTDKFSEMRYNGTGFVSLRLPESKYVKGKNSLQRCALDLLNNKDIPIAAILGCYGSGKTYLATRMALYHVKQKGNQGTILGVREPRGEGTQVGFLAGSFADKTKNFFKPIEQQLDGGEFEINELMQRGTLETNIPFYMKGTTYNSTIILVDEAEDLSESQIRLVGTRLGQESRIFFSGDYSQSNQAKGLSNPLLRMCEAMKGNPLFGCVVLDDDVRSSASKVFANLFK